MSVTLSANVNNDLAAFTKRMAEEENRTVSNVVENALLVFSDMTREMLAYIARAKFDAAMAEIAPYFAQEGDAALTDMELLEQSTAMTRNR